MKQILVFDPYGSGHHLEYLHHLMRNALESPSLNKICFLVDPEAYETFVPKDSIYLKGANFEVTRINVTHFRRLRNLFGIAVSEYLILRKYLRAHSTDVVVLLYADHIANILSLFSLPNLKVVGVFFRTGELFSEAYEQKDIRWLGSIKRILRRRLFRKFMKSRSTHLVLTMDPLLVLQDTDKIRFCPEPLVEQSAAPEQLAELRTGLNLSDHKTCILLFGGIAYRKGFSRFLKSLRQCGRNELDEIQILICGKVIDQKEGENLLEEIRLLEREGISVIFRDRYVPYSDVHLLVKVADIVAVPYIGHVGPSAIVGRAILEGKNVLSTDYGLIGKTVAEYGCGATYSLSDLNSFQRAFESTLSTVKKSSHGSFRDKFVEENTTENFVKTVLESAGN